MAWDADARYISLQRSTTSLIPSAAMQPSHYVPPCPVRILVQSSAEMQPLFCHSSFHLPQCSRHIMPLLVLFVPSFHHLPKCSQCSVTHRTICRNAAVTLCPSLSCSYRRTIFCRNAAFVLSLIVPSAAMQPCRVHSAALSTVMQPRECVFGRVWI